MSKIEYMIAIWDIIETEKPGTVADGAKRCSLDANGGAAHIGLPINRASYTID
jgi:hypothetical protein